MLSRIRERLQVALLVLLVLTPDLLAQQPLPAVKLRTYIGPADYLAAVYAEPAAGANYLFYEEDPAGFEVGLVNKSSDPVSVRLDSQPSTHVALRIANPLGGSQAVARESWTMSSAGIRMHDDRGPDIPVAAGSVVLQPDASLVFPIDFTRSAEWPRGAVALTADISLGCEPACAVEPFSNVFRFEIRATLERIDRIEQAYRRALRALLLKDLDAAEGALQALEAEHSNSLMALFLHARVAHQRGNRISALTYYRAAEATLLARSDALAMKRMGTGLDDFLHTIRTSIRWLETAK